MKTYEYKIYLQIKDLGNRLHLMAYTDTREEGRALIADHIRRGLVTRGRIVRTKKIDGFVIKVKG